VTAAPPPAEAPTAEPAREPSVTAAATSEPVPSTPPPLPDLVDSPGDTHLETAVGLIRAGDNLKARAELTRVLPDIDKAGRLDVKMAAHALLGRVCNALNDEKCAADQYSTVRAAWKDPAAAVRELDAAGGDGKATLERQQRALNAAGEALFYAGEEKKHAADKEKFPAYTGNGDKASVMKHLQTKVAAWVKARTALLEQADKAYAAVAQMQPAAPPRWVVASASRVGQMWGKFVAEFRASPIPGEWKGMGPLPGTNLTREEVRAAYYEAVDEASAPQKTRARAAFKTCQDLSQKLGIKDDYSKHCDTWLEKNYPPAAAAP
jgi:hypothetical protein